MVMIHHPNDGKGEKEEVVVVVAAVTASRHTRDCCVEAER